MRIVNLRRSRGPDDLELVTADFVCTALYCGVAIVALVFFWVAGAFAGDHHLDLEDVRDFLDFDVSGLGE